MALIVLRCVFILVAAGVAVSMFSLLPDDPPWLIWAALIGMLSLAIAVIALDMLIKRFDDLISIQSGTKPH